MARPALTTDALDAMRQRLVAAALDVYRQAGLEALSFRRLADVMGLSHTLPYRYFAHKEALLVAMRVHCTQQFEAFVRARENVDAGWTAQLDSVAAAYVAFVQDDPQAYQLIFTTEQPPPDRYPALLAARRALFDHIVDVLAGGVDDGAIRGEPRQLAHLFWVSFHGLMTLHVANQLVHGQTLHDLVTPLMRRLLGADAAATGA